MKREAVPNQFRVAAVECNDPTVPELLMVRYTQPPGTPDKLPGCKLLLTMFQSSPTRRVASGTQFPIHDNCTSETDRKAFDVQYDRTVIVLKTHVDKHDFVGRIV